MPRSSSEDGAPPLLNEHDLLALLSELEGEENLPASPRAEALDALRASIRAGDDPLGDLFCRVRSTAERRKDGATYTPKPIVRAMFDLCRQQPHPVRVVDPGAGSGRFLIEAGRRFPSAELVGIDLDPIAARMSRANLAVHGLAARSTIIEGDYREIALPPVPGRTLYIGNPPYVRHHLIEPHWKAWLSSTARKLGLAASQLAGLHVHFLLATAERAAPGDYGVFITAAEWLDVNYGSVLRKLFLQRLGGESLVVIEPSATPFPDAATTAVIFNFEVGKRSASVLLKRVSTTDEVAGPSFGRFVRRERLEAESRWSHLTHPGPSARAGYVELGELCRVHRGQVTGHNKVWIEGPHSQGLPSTVLYPCVTRATELFRAGKVLQDPSVLRRVIDIPVELDALDLVDRRRIERFLHTARQLGADQGYVASNRKAWWAVGLRNPAPILATYMARRPPAFVRNCADARHINIAHGLYPRDPMAEPLLASLIDFLSSATRLSDGRTYAGGLVKYEPREMERIMVPGPEMLARGCDA